MSGLVAQDAVIERVLPVKDSDLVSSVERIPRDGVYAVFRAVSGKKAFSNLLGLVPAHAISAAQDMNFGDAVSDREIVSVAASLTLPEALKRLRTSGREALPLVDEEGHFAGAISQRSILEALLKRERELIKKTRVVRQTVSDDKRRLYDAVRRLERVNQAFRKLVGGLVRPAGPEMFQRIIEALAVVCEADYASVSLLDESGRSRESIVAGSAPGEPDNQAEFLKQRWILLEQIVRENRILNIPDVRKHLSSMDPQIKKSMIRNFLGVPISREGHVFGCAYVCNKHNGAPFSDEDEELVATYAAGVGLSLAQVRESARRRRAERERDMLANMGLRLTTAITVEQLGEVVRSTTEELWNWDSFSFTVRPSGHGKMFRLLEVDKTDPPVEMPDGEDYFSGQANDPDRGRVLAPTMPEGVSGMFSHELHSRLEKGECVLINRALDQPGPELDRFGDTSRPSLSMMFAPMMVNELLVGVLSVQSYNENRFRDNDLNLLKRLAEVVGPALGRCQAERRSEAFSSLGYQLSLADTPEDAARVVVDVADQIIGWDACSVYLYDAEMNVSCNVLHMDTIDGEKREVLPTTMVATPGILPQLTINKGPQLILRTEPSFDLQEAAPFGDLNRPSASLMFVPLRVRNAVTGILSIQSYTLNAYDEGDLRLLQALGDHCSGALERTRVHNLE